MESDWEVESWTPPTYSTASFEEQLLTPEDIQHSRDQLQKQTRNISDFAYDPTAWKDRAQALLELGFPELAASDAYKAILLSNEAIERNTKLGEDAWLQHGMVSWGQEWGKASWDHLTADAIQTHLLVLLSEGRLRSYQILLKALKLLEAAGGVKEVCQKALLLYPTDKFVLETATEIQGLLERFEMEGVTEENILEIRLDIGGLLTLSYPWMPSSMRTRDENLIQDTNRQMAFRSAGILQVKESQLGNNCLGVFATRDIRSGEIIINSLGPIGVKCHQMSGESCYNCFGFLETESVCFPCCPLLRFCGQNCKDIAQEFYHKALCGRDFAYLYEAANRARYFGTRDCTPPFSGLAWLRILAICVQSQDHPLKIPLFAMLTPLQNSRNAAEWNFQGKIVEPIKILQALGVDVFTDERFEAWVLESLWSRKTNNYAGGSRIFSVQLDPMYSLFNHSCELKKMLKHIPFSSSRWISRAARDIKEGEEVFTAYTSFSGDRANLNVSARHEELQQWFPDGCACTRCVRELNVVEA